MAILRIAELWDASSGLWSGDIRTPGDKPLNCFIHLLFLVAYNAFTVSTCYLYTFCPPKEEIINYPKAYVSQFSDWEANHWPLWGRGSLAPFLSHFGHTLTFYNTCEIPCPLSFGVLHTKVTRNAYKKAWIRGIAEDLSVVHRENCVSLL